MAESLIRLNTEEEFVFNQYLFSKSDDQIGGIVLAEYSRSVQLSHSVVSDSLRPHWLQYSRPPCPSPTPGVYSKLMSIESVMPSNHLLLCRPLLLPPSIFPSITVFNLFASGGQSIGASASASVLPTNIQDWFPLGWTGLISLQSKGLSKVFTNTIVQKHQILQCSAFFIV